jgi:hypothetical protein
MGKTKNLDNIWGNSMLSKCCLESREEKTGSETLSNKE